MSGFAKRFLQDFLATVSFEACSVLDHIFFFLRRFQCKEPLTCCSRKKNVFIMLFTSNSPSPLSICKVCRRPICYHISSHFGFKNAGGVPTGIAKHPGRYSKCDHLCQDVACSAGVFWVGETLFVSVMLL